ncbi:MAG: hypothetical protein QHC40_15505 [Sphingobium sp.]|uniref:Uncharacterized protein n=1 Tax=Edaphosphingomonas haloaromaticamans TaxID=653954 RepID=A0A1S1HEJ8_9SPHN|nr:hypothetical protein [Sphingomonas haloaromaticamans]MDX3901899.1 hypothetical protein [Sphingobium sp.]OHT19951.1 hypothetical protein BHE75_01944 [Sphingomonas haloaromaticamans]
MSYPAIKPSEIHPSHDVREEGILITDPVCQKCRLGAVENGEKLKDPCEVAAPMTQPNERGAHLKDNGNG